ncbi:hypothetical protein B0I32_113206 [Nonomuraea fuscirosea]|uniref:Uncharacterized protein n=1 Tax=Nonomuraea fuscirosea TaxID=1291556 RepID=A0A2T0MU82_9ACTN|nr:hypothetical protein B0I32_113206 [Nonomuraea fuscirosea]
MPRWGGSGRSVAGGAGARSGWCRGGAEAIAPSPVRRASVPCRVTRSWYATTGRLATNVSTATSPSSSPWPGTEVRGSPCSDQRPITYHLVSPPAAVLARSSTSIQEPGAVRAVHDGTIWVASKPIARSSPIHTCAGVSGRANRVKATRARSTVSTRHIVLSCSMSHIGCFTYQPVIRRPDCVSDHLYGAGHDIRTADTPLRGPRHLRRWPHHPLHRPHRLLPEPHRLVRGPCRFMHGTLLLLRGPFHADR